MKVLLFGAKGRIGSEVLAELLARGHEVTAALRQPDGADALGANVRTVTADSTSASEVAAACRGQDAAISAVGPGSAGDPSVIGKTAAALIKGLKLAGVHRLLIVGGAGTLEIRPGVMRMDTPDYPEQYRPQGIVQKEALAAYRASGLDWTYVSPPIVIAAGEKRGAYRIGGDAVLYSDGGESKISRADFAKAMVDVLEANSNLRRRITVAY